MEVVYDFFHPLNTQRIVVRTRVPRDLDPPRFMVHDRQRLLTAAGVPVKERFPKADVLLDLARCGVRFPLLAAGLPVGARWERFSSLPALMETLCGLEHLYATDTGLYHLATAMCVPTTTFSVVTCSGSSFGSLPWKMCASRNAAQRLCAAVTAWKSPVRCRLKSSMGTTCE